jgi:hypothetical protein
MESKEEISHTGKISEVFENGINVKIGFVEGCSSCQIKGNCMIVEQFDK